VELEKLGKVEQAGPSNPGHGRGPAVD